MEKSWDLCSHYPLKKCSRGRRLLHKDHISSLPDEILLFILSSLSFKEVVKTSLLSRRWLNLWVHTHVLDIHAPATKAFLISDTERRDFVRWVNHVLRRHKGPYLEEFRIVCDLDKRNQKDIDNWLVFAFEKKVESLELNLLFAGRDPNDLSCNYVFPDRLLGLNCGKANLDGGRSPQFDFKCLKSLFLKSVDVTGEAINFFILNCPFLERLEVVGTHKLVNLVISNPTSALKYLLIMFCYDLIVLSISNFNLVSLDIPSVNDLTLTNLPMLAELSIRGTSEKLSCSFSRASSCFSQLEALTIEGYKLKDVSHLSNIDQLTKLKRLVIDIGAWGDESLTVFLSIINSCPRLEEFVLTLAWFKPQRTSRTINEMERCGSSLQCKSLKTFEFLGYYGRACDVELTMHVVDNYVGLEKIIIDPRNQLYISGCASGPPPAGQDEEVRSIALQQFGYLREYIPPNIHLLIR